MLGKFTLKTDHRALKYLFKSRNVKARLARWSLILQEYVFDIEYITGSSNYADYLSREFNRENKNVMEISLRTKKIIKREGGVRTGEILS